MKLGAKEAHTVPENPLHISTLPPVNLGIVASALGGSMEYVR